MKDEEGCAALRYSSVISLTTLAQILFTLARNPWSTASDRLEFLGRCNNALKKVILMVDGMKPLELQYTDVFLGVGVFIYSYNVIVDLLAVRLGLLDPRTLNFASLPFQYDKPSRSGYRISLSDSHVSDVFTLGRRPRHPVNSSSLRP